MDAGRVYGELWQAVLQVYDGGKVNAEKLSAMRAWLNPLRRRRWTPRMMDTVARMDQALAHLFRIARGQEIVAKPPQP